MSTKNVEERDITRIMARPKKKIRLHSGSLCFFRKAHLAQGYVQMDDVRKGNIVVGDNDEDNITRYSYVRLHSCNCCRHFTICKVKIDAVPVTAYHFLASLSLCTAKFPYSKNLTLLC